MKRNQFKCMVCQSIRERGNFVQIEHGAFEGHVVKVCKKSDCATSARAGTKWVVDPLYAEIDAKVFEALDKGKS